MIDWENVFNSVSVTLRLPGEASASAQGLLSVCHASDLRTENAPGALWLLLRTWSALAFHLRSNAAALHPYNEFRRVLGLDEPSLKARYAELDKFLDRVDETIDDFALASGIR